MSRVSIDEFDHHGNLRNGYDGVAGPPLSTSNRGENL